jgi:hypothetical protein
MPDPEYPNDPQEDREPPRRENLGVDEEADETDEEELADENLGEHLLVALSDDDLKDMEGPDA